MLRILGTENAIVAELPCGIFCSCDADLTSCLVVAFLGHDDCDPQIPALDLV
jgi:hypothetical protein